MVMQNPFDNSAFDMVTLTKAINLIPLQYGRFGDLGLFPGRGVPTTTIIVEYKNNMLNLLPTQPRGAPGTLGERGKRNVRSFVIPHIPHDDVVMPDEAQGVRAFGSESQMDTLQAVMNDKLITMGNKHDITEEHLRAGAVRGIVIDADGSTIINFFTEFGVTEKVVDFDLAVSTAVRAACMEVHRHIKTNLMGDVMTSVRAFCAPDFWDALIANDDVKSAYDRWQDGAFLRQDPRTAFEFGGIEFEEYDGTASDLAGNARVFVPAGTCRIVPMGTRNTFETVYAPADFNETVNTRGRARYAKQEPRKFNRGTDLHTQSNPLPLCLRPQVLVKGTLT